MDKPKIQAIRFHTMAIVLIIVFAAAVTPVTLQNDTYYTISIGEYILENGVTMQEPFSWHENLEYTFPHWAYDVLIYLIYSIGGMTGIYISTIVLGAVLGLIMYYVNVRLVKNRLISFLLTIVTLYLLRPYICARAQLVTFILFILTIYFIERFLETKKLRYALGLIVIPILIANLHTATFFFYFILYAPYFAEYAIYVLAYSNVIISEAVCNSIRKKIQKNGETEQLLQKLQREETRYNKLKQKQDSRFENPYKIKVNYYNSIKWLGIIFLVCICTGLLTPLGSTPYTYLIKTMQGISTKNISEHLPVVLASNKELLILLAVYIVTLMTTRVKIRISDFFMLAGLIVLTIFTRRQASMLYLIGVIILNKILTGVLYQYNKNSINKLDEYASKIIGIIIISIMVIVTAILQYKPKIDDEYVDTIGYPVQAANWIKENLNLEEIKIYNEYNYGSYLLYQGIPVFIDSRCDLYMPEFNEETYVFRDFINLNNANLEDMEEKIEDYGFTHFVISKNVKMRKYLQANPDKYEKIYPTDDITDEKFSIYERIK